jgi:dipeptidyl aminopeptidase/acylaminoacyl peptidase
MTGPRPFFTVEHIGSPVASPRFFGGKKVLFGYREAERDWLYLADIGARRLTRISPFEPNKHLHNISDEGKRILFVKDNVTVWLVDAETGSSRLIRLAPPGRLLEMATGSRDGKRVLIEVMDRKTRGTVELRLIDVTGGR